MAKVDVYNTNNKYQIIYADPPWKYGRTGKKKWKPAKHYFSTHTQTLVPSASI